MSATDPRPIISHACPDGTLAETIYDRGANTTALAIGRPDGSIDIVTHFDLPDCTRLVPYSPTNNLLATGCVLLPSGVGEIATKAELIGAIRSYLCRYVDLSPAFLDLAPYYVLLTWVYDAFNELPYLRFRGDYGTGKTRALLTLGSICYKPFFASGASTVSPIFHILDSFRGSLILDEADFRFSEMTGELTKILNNGTVNGLPVLRTMTNRHRELNPQAFRVYGPKIVAMRESFSDRALESRFFTEEMGRRPLPPHVPVHTPASLADDATALRNQLLGWRLVNRYKEEPKAEASISGASSRLNQMAMAILSLVDDGAERDRVAAYLGVQDRRAQDAKRETTEALVVAALVDAFAQATGPIVRLADVADRFNRQTSERFHFPLSNKAVGHVVREKLGITTFKSHGVYGIRQEERERVRALAEGLGVPHTLPTIEPRFPQEAPPREELDASTERAQTGNIGERR